MFHAIISDESKLIAATAAAGVQVTFDFSTVEVVTTVAYCVLVAVYVYDKLRRRPPRA